MKYLDYCYLCINNRKASELSENPECSNCIQLTVISMPTKFKSRRITWAASTSQINMLEHILKFIIETSKNNGVTEATARGYLRQTLYRMINYVYRLG